MIFAALRHPLGQLQIVAVKLTKARTERNITGTDLPFSIFDNGIHRQGIITKQFPTDRKQVKFPNLRCGLSDTPAKQHIEFHLFAAAELDQSRNIKGFKKGHHGVGGRHPKGKGFGSGRCFRIDNNRFYCNHFPSISAEVLRSPWSKSSAPHRRTSDKTIFPGPAESGQWEWRWRQR